MIGNKRKITFTLTVGSEFTENSTDKPTLPQGGTFTDNTIEFEQKTNDPFKEACDALKTDMSKQYPGMTYHIWYWNWWTYE